MLRWISGKVLVIHSEGIFVAVRQNYYVILNIVGKPLFGVAFAVRYTTLNLHLGWGGASQSH